MSIPGDELRGDAGNYKAIAYVLMVSFLINGIALVGLNLDSVVGWLHTLMGPVKTFMIQLFFWGAAGATIAGSRFLANDKQQNIDEGLKEVPDPSEIQYPDKIDVWLYAQRILSSGFLAIFGAAILFAGLGYFEISIDQLTAKHKVFLIVFAVVIGLYENRFLVSLDRMSRNLFLKHSGSKK